MQQLASKTFNLATTTLTTDSISAAIDHTFRILQEWGPQCYAALITKDVAVVADLTRALRKHNCDALPMDCGGFRFAHPAGGKIVIDTSAVGRNLNFVWAHACDEDQLVTIDMACRLLAPGRGPHILVT